jgi:hypothetical protein
VRTRAARCIPVRSRQHSFSASRVLWSLCGPDLGKLAGDARRLRPRIHRSRVSSPVARKADIQKKLKIALDETQMLIMGVQILIGFQLQHAIGLGMMTLAIVLLGAGCLSPACLRGGGYPHRPQDRLHLRNSGTRGLGPWARRGSHGRNRRVERPTGHRRAHGRDRSRGAVRALVRLAIGDPGASAASNSKAVTMNPARGSRGVSLPPSGLRPFATRRSIVSCRVPVGRLVDQLGQRFGRSSSPS